MSKRIQLRRGNTSENNAFTGAVGEVTVDTDKDTVVVHDGVTAGGHPVATRANADGTISLIKKDGTSAGTINTLGLFNNTLNSTNSDQALTAAQGKVLKDRGDMRGLNYSNLTGTRVKGTLYTNSSDRVRYVCITGDVTSGQTMRVFVGGVLISDVTSGGAAWGNTILFPVPIGATYKVDNASSIMSWSEL